MDNATYGIGQLPPLDTTEELLASLEAIRLAGLSPQIGSIPVEQVSDDPIVYRIPSLPGYTVRRCTDPRDTQWWVYRQAPDLPAHCYGYVTTAGPTPELAAGSLALYLASQRTDADHRTCQRCGESGYTGDYPFSTAPDSGYCDDCL